MPCAAQHANGNIPNVDESEKTRRPGGGAGAFEDREHSPRPRTAISRRAMSEWPDKSFGTVKSLLPFALGTKKTGSTALLFEMSNLKQMMAEAAKSCGRPTDCCSHLAPDTQGHDPPARSGAFSVSGRPPSCCRSAARDAQHGSARRAPERRFRCHARWPPDRPASSCDRRARLPAR